MQGPVIVINLNKYKSSSEINISSYALLRSPASKYYNALFHSATYTTPGY